MQSSILPFDADALVQSAPRKFDTDAARDWLRREVDWPSNVRLDDVRMGRLWVGKPGRVWFELELSVTRDDRPATVALQGTYIYIQSDRPSHLHNEPEFAHGGVMGLSVANEELGV